MTINQLIRGPYRSTLNQLTILSRADLMNLPAGRFYGGHLTEEQLESLISGLTPIVEVKNDEA